MKIPFALYHLRKIGRRIKKLKRKTGLRIISIGVKKSTFAQNILHYDQIIFRIIV